MSDKPGSDEVTAEIDTTAVRDASRHLRIGEMTAKFYEGLSMANKHLVKGWLPQELVNLLERR